MVVHAAGGIVVGNGKGHRGLVGVGVGRLHNALAEGVCTNDSRIEESLVTVVTDSRGEYLACGGGVFVTDNRHGKVDHVILAILVVGLDHHLFTSLVLVGENGETCGNDIGNNVANAVNVSAGVVTKVEYEATGIKSHKLVNCRLELGEGVFLEGNDRDVGNTRLGVEVGFNVDLLNLSTGCGDGHELAATDHGDINGSADLTTDIVYGVEVAKLLDGLAVNGIDIVTDLHSRHLCRGFGINGVDHNALVGVIIFNHNADAAELTAHLVGKLICLNGWTVDRVWVAHKLNVAVEQSVGNGSFVVVVYCVIVMLNKELCGVSRMGECLRKTALQIVKLVEAELKVAELYSVVSGQAPEVEILLNLVVGLSAPRKGSVDLGEDLLLRSDLYGNNAVNKVTDYSAGGKDADGHRQGEKKCYKGN